MPRDLTPATRFAAALRRIYDRPQPPAPWRGGANLPRACILHCDSCSFCYFRSTIYTTNGP